MMRKDLAAALGISNSMVTKLAKRGMPTDSVERAQRWRRRHLEPGRVKGVRMDTSTPMGFAEAVSVDELQLEIVRRLALLAENDFMKWSEQLRGAMRLVQRHLRPQVQLPLEVWRQLLPAQAIADCQADVAEDTTMTEAEKNEISHVFFELACGLATWNAA